MSETKMPETREKLIKEIRESADEVIAEMKKQIKDLRWAAYQAREAEFMWTDQVNQDLLYNYNYRSSWGEPGVHHEDIREGKHKATAAYNRKHRLCEECERVEVELKRFKRQTDIQIRVLRLEGQDS